GQYSSGLLQALSATATPPYNMARASSQRIVVILSLIMACVLLLRGWIRGRHMAPDSPAQPQVLRGAGQMLPEPLEVSLLPSPRIRLCILAGIGRGQHLQRVCHAAVLPAGRVEHRRHTHAMSQVGSETGVSDLLPFEGGSRCRRVRRTVDG